MSLLTKDNQRDTTNKIRYTTNLFRFDLNTVIIRNNHSVFEVFKSRGRFKYFYFPQPSEMSFKDKTVIVPKQTIPQKCNVVVVPKDSCRTNLVELKH